jgi:predicted MPP superfamily phosphohydrolase
MQKRIQVEAYFAASGRTLRKGRFRLWFNEEIKPQIMRAVFILSGLYQRGKRNSLAVSCRQIEFRFANLPVSFDGFTILQISDLHIDKVDGLAEIVAEVVAPLRPDICVFTGDYRYEIRGSCAEVYPRMRTVLAPVQARAGIYAILGNHDAAEIAHWLAAQNVTVLMNDSVPLEQNGARIWILGTDDPYDYRCDDLPQAMSGVPVQEFKILLTHTPSLYRQAAESGIDLYLCGHTHAGQIRLPYVGALKKNGPFPREFAQGAWSYGNMRAYTSWGTGCSTIPVRYNCPPEVTLISLRKS